MVPLPEGATPGLLGDTIPDWSRGSEDGDGGALAKFAGERNHAAGLIGKAMHLGKAKAGALADRLGRKERVEHFSAKTSGGMPVPVSDTRIATKSPLCASSSKLDVLGADPDRGRRRAWRPLH